jgi:regulatory protein
VTDEETLKKLMLKAGRHLARRQLSRSELASRLLREAGEAEVRAVLDRLEQVNLLNDAEYAYNLGFRRITQDGWGPLRIRHALLRRGIPSSLADLVLERVRREAGEERVLREYVERHCRRGGPPADARGLRRLVAHLKRRGFHDSAIQDVLRNMVPDILWERLNTGD